MAQLKELVETEELEAVWEASNENPVLLFKQNTACPISAAAFADFKNFVSENDISSFYLKVRESRPVSNKVEEELGIEHESPQIFLVKNGKAVWDESFDKITLNGIKDAVEKSS